MITTLDKTEILHISGLLPVWRCKWCQPHRYFVRGLDGRTMFVDRPDDDRPSDGICNVCDTRVRKEAGLPQRDFHAVNS
jgi:hypothetical protein